MAMSRGQLDQHIVVRSRDEIARLAISFNEMAAAIAEVDRMKSEFVSIASHELRTPIHAMLLGVSGILEGYSGEIGEEVREDLQIVDEGITRLRGLVESLLDLSRIEAYRQKALLDLRHELKTSDITADTIAPEFTELAKIQAAGEGFEPEKLKAKEFIYNR